MTITLILAGVPGSGKSTILNETLKLLPNLKIINYGEMMLHEASFQKIDKDSLRKLPLVEQQKIGLEAARKMALNLPEIVCIDTHAMIKTPFGYCPGLPEAVIRLLKPQIVAMVECNPAIIHERRKTDLSRNRDLETVEQIDYHQQISRSFLLACTAMAGTLFTPVYNHGHPVDAAKQIILAINTLKK